MSYTQNKKFQDCYKRQFGNAGRVGRSHKLGYFVEWVRIPAVNLNQKITLLPIWIRIWAQQNSVCSYNQSVCQTRTLHILIWHSTPVVIFLQLLNFHRCVGVHTSIYNIRVWYVFRTALRVARCLVGTNVTGTCLLLYSLFTYLFVCLFVSLFMQRHSE